MAIPNLFSLLDSSNTKLTQSADSLESALAQFSKLAASIEQPTVSGPLYQNGGGFDSWLAAEFQYGAFLGGEETSSVAPSPSTVSEESPLLELENLVGTGPSLFEPSSLGLPSVPTLSLPQSPISSSSNTTSFSALQRAAAELNIPWSEELGLAYLARVQSTSVEVPSLPAVSLVAPSPSPLASPVLSSIAGHKTVSPAKTTTSNKKRAVASFEEESDEVLAKRAKNTDAARRSRLKKLVKLETLEVKVHELEATNNRLNMRIAVLETEKNNFLIKDAEQAARIAQLEAKVVEAHLALTNRS
ncbi:hypothetical protein BGZ93_008021 [Podila epicladia]|nr:hypothetical protein BGZ92_011111 [Podila epicladia]KAG0093093.1 hypothetical protein BGZ93_008021 [Podila epicladia]